MEQLILFLIVGAVVYGIIVYAKKLEQERSQQIGTLARNMGFEFQVKPAVDFVGDYSHFQLFGSGHSKKIKNYLSNNHSALEAAIFGYQYTTGGGKNSTTHRHTVVSFSGSQQRFPDFDLRPEHIFHKIGKVFGYQDINFDFNPEFSRKYLLQGRNEKAIRRLFNSDLVSLLAERPEICIEARDNTVIFYQPANRLSPEQIEDFYHSTHALYQAFCEALQ